MPATGKGGVAKKGIIFNYEAIDTGQVFGGSVLGEKDDLTQFLAIFTDGIYHVGRSRNSQYGRIRLNFIDREPKELLLPEVKDGEVVLTLLSDTIIYNENGFPTTDISEFQKLIGCQVKKAFVKPAHEEGFVSVWGLKRPSTTCFKAGSCFLIEVKPEHKDKLLKLQEQGIGERTNEGFGRFKIGWQTGELNAFKEAEDSPEKEPYYPVPELAKEKVIQVVQDFILMNTRADAIKEASDAERLPTTSFLGKLELMVKNSNSLEEFRNKIKDLAKRKTVMDKLEGCRIMNKTLYQHLIELNFDDKVQSTIKNKIEVENLLNVTKIKITEIYDQSLKAVLFKEYLTTLFSVMRKRAKQGGNK